MEFAQRDDEFLIYIGRLARGEQGNRTPLRYYAFFQRDKEPQLISWSSKNPPQHVQRLTGKVATRFLKERGFRIDRSGISPQLVKANVRKK
jgi:hypothetical protein